MIVAIAALLLRLGVAGAAAEEPEGDLHENTVGGAPVQERTDTPVEVPVVASDEKGLAAYSPLTYKTAEVLRVDVVFADRCRRAIEAIYARKYKESKAELDSLSKDYPTTGIGPAGTAVIYQALMFENFDLRYEKQYRAAHEAALRQIGDGQKTPGNEAIESFLLAGMMGIDGIHRVRKGEYLAAISAGLDAVRALADVKAAAPGFVDPLLGDGMWLYWRTVVSRMTPLLPDGTDDREAGKVLMKQVEKEGVLMSPAATLSLAYSFIEEGDLRNALARSMYGRSKYPDNVINNMTAGRVLSQMRRYDESVRMYRAVLATAPDNQRSHYHLGVVLARQGKLAEAETAYRTYVAFTEPPADARGAAWYRLGLVYARQGRPADAKAAYEQAVAVSNNAAAKKALEKMQK